MSWDSPLQLFSLMPREKLPLVGVDIQYCDAYKNASIYLKKVLDDHMYLPFVYIGSFLYIDHMVSPCQAYCTFILPYEHGT